MSKVVLTRPEVGDKYECNAEKDVIVHANGYSGKLSNINLAGAEHMVKSKSPFLKEKAAAKGSSTAKDPKTENRT